jgi:FkbM family methyltransferase
VEVPSGRVAQTRAALNRIYSGVFHKRRNRVKPLDIDSYAQFGEDVCIRLLLGSRNGRYVDIGSGHPIAGSNSYAFYKLGWTGVLVDPLLSNVCASRTARKRDRVHQACVGTQSGSVEFFEYDVYQYSTTSPERVEELSALGYEPKHRYQSPTIRLSDLEISALPTEPVFLSIDVEGMEMEVLESNDWASFLPAVIAIEEWETPLARVTTVFTYLQKFGYELVAVVGVTSVYRHCEYVSVS